MSKYKAGFIGIIGQPNAGKSSLMNALIEEKVSIVSPKPQTTRRRVIGVAHSDLGQIVFIDAPGLVRSQTGINPFLKEEFDDVIKNSDALLAVLSVDEKDKESINDIIDIVAKSGKPWLAWINKVDIADKQHRVGIIKQLISEKGGQSLMGSATKMPKEVKDEMIALLTNLLPEAPGPLYDIELFTPHTIRDLVPEIVREKCFEHLHQEIPYGLAVRVIKFDESLAIPKIFIEIILEKENHKAIVIGKSASTLKKISQSSRIDIEKLIGGKVFLDVHVAVREGWMQNKNAMKELGYVVDSE